MSLNSINTNIAAYYAQQNIGRASNAASSSIARLSSGDRIVRAADDVAALSVGTSLRTQVTTLKQALGNTSQGASLLQVADGSLSQVSDILQRQKAIAVQAGSGSLSASERSFLNQEFQNLSQEIDRISNQTNFNGVKLLDGSLTSSGSFITTDPAANTNYTFTTAIDNNSINAIAVVAAVDATNGLNPNAIGDITNVSYANVGAADDGTAIRIRFQVNGVLFEGVGNFSAFDATASGETVAVTLTEVGPTFNDSAGATNDPMQILLTVEELGGTIVNSLASFNTAVGTSLTTSLQSTYVSQQRNLTSFSATTADGSVLEGLSATPQFTTWTMDTIIGDGFGNVENVTVVPVGDATDANGSITVRINGADYTLADLNTATGSDGILAAGNTLTFTRTFEGSTRTETLTLALTGLDAEINVNTVQGAQALEEALKQVLGAGDVTGSGGLTFQVGNVSSDSLTVAFDGVTTATLFANASLDVLTSDSAATATDVVDAAIKTVTGVRATVGALQSRFDFAAANLESSIQNQDAARGVLLDTDIAAEATAYATAQVQLQAGIAVLAQANQLPQNLLKLIG